MFKRLLFFLLVIVLLAGCDSDTSLVATKTEQNERDNIPVLLRKPEQWGDAPNFMALRVGGGDFQLSSLKGKVILINFWSVDCPACKVQISGLTELYKKYAREDLEIIGVCLDRETIVKRFTNVISIDYVLVLLNQDIMNKYGRDLRFLPTTFVIDRQGNIAEKYAMAEPVAIFERDIRQLLQRTVENEK